MRHRHCAAVALDGGGSVLIAATASRSRIAGPGRHLSACNAYPRVDDDATIILTYPSATATIQASWAWTHDNKEADIYTERGSIHAGKWDDLQTRNENGPLKPIKPSPKGADLENEWTYFRQVVRGKCAVDPLSSLELNLIAVEILDAARQAAHTPKK